MADLLDELQSTAPVEPEMPENIEELALLSTVSRMAQNIDAIGAAIQNLAQRLDIVEDVLQTILLANPDVKERTAALVQETVDAAAKLKEERQQE